MSHKRTYPVSVGADMFEPAKAETSHKHDEGQEEAHTGEEEH